MQSSGEKELRETACLETGHCCLDFSDLLSLERSFCSSDRIFLVMKISKVEDEILKRSVQQVSKLDWKERVDLRQPKELSLVFREHIEAVSVSLEAIPYLQVSFSNSLMQV